MAVLQFREALREAIDEEMDRDERYLSWVRKLPNITGLIKLQKGFLINMGLRE
jgi:hypothetical protein